MCRRERVVHNTSDVQNRTKRRVLCRREKDWMTAGWRRMNGRDRVNTRMWWYLMASK
jgi:hypothetical protein